MTRRTERTRFAILIQKVWRGYITRKLLYKLKDEFNSKLIKKALTNHIDNTKCIKTINKQLKYKKFRNTNFPSEISENIVKYAIRQYYHICPTWDTKKGDLIIDLLTYEKTIEVKGFSSKGPSSFGPKESWDIIYFIDCSQYSCKKFIVYEIRLSNRNPRWYNLKMNSRQTYKQVCLQGKRPRISFDKILSQIKKKYIRIIFDGMINKLL